MDFFNFFHTMEREQQNGLYFNFNNWYLANFQKWKRINGIELLTHNGIL